MNKHVDFDQLQDYREKLLSPEEHEEIRVHLEECPACKEDLAALSELMDGLAELPQEAEPSRDLWPQVEWRLSGPAAERERPPSRRMVTMQRWQLLAASITVAMISGGAVWAFLAGTPQGSVPAMTGAPSMAHPASLEAAYAPYDDAVLELEGILDEGREILGPETIQILEENLLIIDRAIAESQEALFQDPGSRVLRRILSETMRRNVDLLQQAAVAIYANS